MVRNTSRNCRSGVPGLIVSFLSLSLSPFLMAQTAATGTLSDGVKVASTDGAANSAVSATKLDADNQRSDKAAPQEKLPNAPASGATASLLEDLGISPEQKQGSAQG